MSLLDPFAPAQAVADAVLYEGYVLYPYRASADKNRLRWQWGVVGPVGAHEAGVGEAPTMRAELPVEVDDRATVRLRVRFLRVVSRRVERLHDDGTVEVVSSVVLDDTNHVSFDDAEEQHVDVVLAIGADGGTSEVDVELGGTTAHEQLGSDDRGTYRLTRRSERITAHLDATATREGSGHVVRVALANTTPWSGGDRDAADLRSLVGAHVLGAIEGGLFVSTTEPPAEHVALADACRGLRLWPVVIGAAQRASLVLASPVILYDQPELAPESRGSFYDGLEIDEMLTLRVMTMTEQEKAEARATDPRAAAVVDMVEGMDADDLAGLHGTIRAPDGRVPSRSDPPGRETDFPTIVGDGSSGSLPTGPEGGDGEQPWWDPGSDSRFDPATDGVVVAGTPISRGSVVRLRPGARADAHDIFYRGRTATVSAVLHDVDGSVHIAVTIDDDPAAELFDATGRFLYFHPDEVEPLGTRVDR